MESISKKPVTIKGVPVIWHKSIKIEAAKKGITVDEVYVKILESGIKRRNIELLNCPE